MKYSITQRLFLLLIAVSILFFYIGSCEIVNVCSQARTSFKNNDSRIDKGSITENEWTLTKNGCAHSNEVLVLKVTSIDYEEWAFFRIRRQHSLQVSTNEWKGAILKRDENMCFLFKPRNIYKPDFSIISSEGCVGAFWIVQDDIFPVNISFTPSYYMDFEFSIDMAYIYQQELTTTPVRTTRHISYKASKPSIISHDNESFPAKNLPENESLNEANFTLSGVSMVIGLIIPTVILIIAIWLILWYRKQLMIAKQQGNVGTENIPNNENCPREGNLDLETSGEHQYAEPAYSDITIEPTYEQPMESTYQNL
uniref:uncharacterized protein LOC120334990 n=1 Tax=Styela clava TaxID=7725 RepID=UPI00193A60D3|nr:uncharacterized protein LOC120334990 [Styela clava]